MIRNYSRVIKKTAAVNLTLPLEQGVYICSLPDRHFEITGRSAYVRVVLGADAVGMSTACEAVAANHMRMHICGISCIANMACGITPNPLTHKEVQEAADRVAPRFKKLVTKSIINIAKEIPLDE